MSKNKLFWFMGIFWVLVAIVAIVSKGAILKFIFPIIIVFLFVYLSISIFSLFEKKPEEKILEEVKD